MSSSLKDARWYLALNWLTSSGIGLEWEQLSYHLQSNLLAAANEFLAAATPSEIESLADKFNGRE